MSRLFLIALIVSVGLITSEALAQRDGGAKARGDQRSFWDPSYRSSGGGSFEYRPTGPPVQIYEPSVEVLSPSVQSYRSFSYQPLAISPGDTVVVNGDNVRMMRGTNVVGTVPNGLNFEVTKIINGWLGGVVDVDGQTLNGWIWHANVIREDGNRIGGGTAAVPQQPGPVYRRYSYEPLPSTRTYPRNQSGRMPWGWENPKGLYRSN